MPNFSAAAGALGVTQQFQSGPTFQQLLDQQNNDMLLKQRRQKTLANGQPDPNARYSNSGAYRDLLGLGPGLSGGM